MVLTPKPFHSLKGLLDVRTNPILPISSTQEIVTSPTSRYVSRSITNLRPSSSWIRSDSRIVSTHRYSEGSQHPLKWRSMRMGCWIPLSVRIDLITWLTPGSSLTIWIALPPFSLLYLMNVRAEESFTYKMNLYPLLPLSRESVTLSRTLDLNDSCRILKPLGSQSF